MQLKSLFACLAFCCVSVPSVSFGRLGENEQELERRYGRPFYQTTDKANIPPGGEKRLNYLRENITVHVTLSRGRSVAEGYEFKDNAQEPLPIEGKVLQTAEAILEANSEGHEWKRHPIPRSINPDILHVWQRSDGGASAVVWEKEPNMLELSDTAFMQESNRARKAASAGASGF